MIGGVNRGRGGIVVAAVAGGGVVVGGVGGCSEMMNWNSRRVNCGCAGAVLESDLGGSTGI